MGAHNYTSGSASTHPSTATTNTSMAGSPWLDEAAAAAQLSHAPCQPAGPRREHAGQRRVAKALRVRHRRRGLGSTCPTSRQLGAPAGAASVRAAARTAARAETAGGGGESAGGG